MFFCKVLLQLPLQAQLQEFEWGGGAVSNPKFANGWGAASSGGALTFNGFYQPIKMMSDLGTLNDGGALMISFDGELHWNGLLGCEDQVK